MWKDIKLFENPKCRNESPPGVMSLVFCGSLAPVSESAYRVTFNVKWKQFMIWANKFQVDTVLHVTQGNEDEVPLSVPINFPCGQNPAHGDSRDSAMPDPSRMAGSRPSRAGDPLNSSRPPGASIILDGDGAEVPEIAEEPADEEAAAAEPEAPVEAADGEAADAAPAEEGAEEEAVDFEAEADETLRESQEHQDDVEMLVLL
ncbi:hypothetical protein EGW08_013683 [Elysia chlorotica]|uniref:Uncharacterized protein n=1 Tax=Elysia chlorotica TaxID=188477 RepID=A0A3S0ZIG7_ELYCH|nr:hypothetical protein EGW08_013683 [Elysia chlorotica]